jgi:hypothetical protein
VRDSRGEGWKTSYEGSEKGVNKSVGLERVGHDEVVGRRSAGNGDVRVKTNLAETFASYNSHRQCICNN